MTPQQPSPQPVPVQDQTQSVQITHTQVQPDPTQNAPVQTSSQISPTMQLASALDNMTIEEKLLFLQQQQQLLYQQHQDLIRQQQEEKMRQQQEEQRRLQEEQLRIQQEQQRIQQEEQLKRQQEEQLRQQQEEQLKRQQEEQLRLQQEQLRIQQEEQAKKLAEAHQVNVAPIQVQQITPTTSTIQAEEPTTPKSPVAKTIDLNDPNTIWKEAKAPNGRTYYYNKITKQTTWQRPQGFTGYQPAPSPTQQHTQTHLEPQTQQLQPQQTQIVQENTTQLVTPSTPQQTVEPETSSPQFNHLFHPNLTTETTAQPTSQPSTVPVDEPVSETNSLDMPVAFPKFLKVKLPEDQRQVVKFRPDQTLRSVLKRICASRPFSEEDYVPKDKSGNNLDMDKTLGDLGQEEISFIVPSEGYKPRDEADKKAQNLMAEIYQANASLSSTLFTILRNYRDPLLESARDSDPRKKVLTENQCNQIFSSLESIAKACKEFNLTLAPQLEKWPLDLSTMFRDHMSVVPYYMNYVNNYKSAMGTLEELRANKLFSDQVDGIQKASGNKLRLEELLSLPAVKLSKLVELIESLCEILGDTHVDYMTLKEFHQRLLPHKLTAEKLRREYEARNKLLYIQSNVAKLPKRQNLLHEQRCFFREGIFDVETKKSKQAPYYVYLFTDFLVLCKFEKKAKRPISYTFFDIINFVPRQTTAEEVPSSSYSFVIQVDDPKKGKLTYTCTITNQTEGTKADWMTSIKDAVDDFNSKPELHNK